MNTIQQHIRSLKNGNISAWNDYRSKTSDGPRRMPRVIRISQENLSGLDLSNADFTNVEFQDVKFCDSNCTRTDFRWSSFRDCDFSRANLTMTNFISSGISTPKKTTFHSVSFESCLLDGTEFKLNNLSGCSFARSIFNTTFFTAVICRNVSFKGASLKNIQMKAAKIERARLFLNLNALHEKRALESPGTNFHSDFTGADFTDATIHAFHTKAILDSARFTRTKVYETVFRQASIRNCDVTDALFKWCRFERAEIGGTDFESASLVESEFFKCYI